MCERDGECFVKAVDRSLVRGECDRPVVESTLTVGNKVEVGIDK